MWSNSYTGAEFKTTNRHCTILFYFTSFLQVENERSASLHTDPESLPPPTEGGVTIDSTAEQLGAESEGGTAEDRAASGYSPPPPPPGGDELREEPLTVELLKQKEAEEGGAGTYTVADE